MKKRYITGFDGVRTLAVIGVILYHLMPFKFQGGFLGVPIFLVLSGYLITDHLFIEYDRTHTVDIIGFYKRRMKRLYPALVTMLMATTAYLTLFQRQLLVHIKGVLVTNLLYVYNWFEIYHGESYFDKFGNQSPFTHLWTLSIEGQFYLFWPLVMILLFIFVRKKQTYFDIFLIFSFVSALLMAVLYHVGQDPSRVYYGTDTRMFSILLGACLAVVWPSGRLSDYLETKPRLLLDAVGIVSFILMIWMFMKSSGQSELLYRGGMFFFSVLTVLFIGTVAHPGADINRLMTNPVFTWIGKRSYGIYIYQYPVLIFYELSVPNVAAHPWINAFIEVAIILAISELSYRFIEKKLQHYDYSHLWSDIREFFSRDSAYGWKRIWGVLAVAMVAIAMVGVAHEPSASAVQKDNHLAAAIKKNEKQVKSNNKRHLSKAEIKKQEKAHNGLTKSQKKAAAKMKITAVGDSVMADGSTTLQGIFPKMYIDAKVGRQVDEIIPILQSLKASGKLSKTILVSEGTNGPFTPQTMSQIMKIAGKRKVYWVNVHVPTKTWQNQVNNDLKKSAKKYSNLKIINWYSYCQNHPEWFYGDNVHPNPKGLKHYGKFIAKNILADK